MARSKTSNKTEIDKLIDLGVLGGDQEYVTLRVTDLVDKFNVIMKTILTRSRTVFTNGEARKISEYRPLALRNTPPGMAGHTDCKTFVSVPLHQYDGFLVAEHELSHNLFQSDLGMVKGFQNYVIQKIFSRAGIPMQSSEAELYRPGLEQCFFQCWNLLEDLRVCNHWSKIYEGSGKLLWKRWVAIVSSEQYDVAKENIIAYVSRKSLGVDTPDCNPLFKKFDQYITEAADTAIHTNSKGCIAITARLFTKIAEVLLNDIKDNPEKYGGGQPKGGTALWKKTIVVLSSKSKAVNVTGMPGGDDMRHGANNSAYVTQFKGNRKLPKVPTDSNWKDIQKMRKMVDNHPKQKQNLPPDALTDFEKMLEDGEQEMEDLVDAAIDAMIEEQQKAMQDEVEEEETDFKQLMNFQSTVGIRCVEVKSKNSSPLPEPSEAAHRTKYELEKIKAQFKHRLDEDGEDLIVEEHIDALLNNELPDADIFEETTIESGFDILLLVDVSGSMSGTGIEVVDKSIADIKYSIEGTKITLKVWGFSNEVFVLDEAASMKNPDIKMWGTAMIRSLDMAYEWASLNKSKRAIILVTDGYPSYCRARRSTGDAQKDFSNLMHEIEADGVPISTIAVGGWGSAESNISMYDKIFGKGRYGYAHGPADAGPAINRAATALVTEFLKRRA